MSIDPQEVAAFKTALAQTPVEIIVKRLNDNVILRTWKRNLAEAEIARRAHAGRNMDLKPKLMSGNRHQAAETLSWFATVFMIACACAVVAAVTVRLIT